MVNETEVTIERAVQLTGFTRHHIERLVKAGVIRTKNGEGETLLDVASLESYSEKRAQKRAQKKEDCAEQEESIVTDGAKYVSVNRASRLSGYTQEYIQNLGADGTIQTKFFGERLYIGIESLFAHRRAVHAQQAKWYEEQARTKAKKEEPVVVHRVSIYNKDDAPLFPVLSSKHEKPVPAAAETERMQTGSRLKTVVLERPRKSTPSPFTMRAPERPQEVTVHESVKTRAVAAERREVQHPQPKKKQGGHVFGRALSLTVTIAALLTSVYMLFMMATVQTHTARAAFIIGDILGLTETTIPYYRK